MRRLLVHLALWLGCLVFAFPFAWLVGTSFKYDEEIFVYPPQWLPSMPPQILHSPYITAETLPPLEPPAELRQSRWQGLWPQLQDALWERGAHLLAPGQKEGLPEQRLRAVLAHGLFAAAARGVPREVWSREDAQIASAVCARVDSALLVAVWNNIYREIALRDLSVRDLRLDLHPLGPGSFLDRWLSAQEGLVLARRPYEARLGEEGPLTLECDFSRAERLSLSGVFPLPVRARDFLGFVLPIRQDRSWHRLRVELEMGGRRYALEEGIYLGQRRWQEIGFKLQERDERDERDLGIWPLLEVEGAGPAFDEEGLFRLKLEVERASRLQAVWRKYMDTYRSAYLATEHRWRYVLNSVYLTALSILGQVLSCSLVAYAFARLRWPGRDLLFGLLLATMMLPGQVTMIPVFLVFKHLGWYNTLKALWVPSFLGSAFFIFMLRQFMKGIPADLEEAAKIDGCSLFGIYWRIVLPLMKPALAAVGVFTFMNAWNDFMGPLIYLNDQRLYPLALGLFDFRTQHGSEFGMLMAASTLMTLPVIAIFFVAQRYFIQGVTLTGMKG